MTDNGHELRPEPEKRPTECFWCGEKAEWRDTRDGGKYFCGYCAAYLADKAFQKLSDEDRCMAVGLERLE